MVDAAVEIAIGVVTVFECLDPLGAKRAVDRFEKAALGVVGAGGDFAVRERLLGQLPVGLPGVRSPDVALEGSQG